MRHFSLWPLIPRLSYSKTQATSTKKPLNGSHFCNVSYLQLYWRYYKSSTWTPSWRPVTSFDYKIQTSYNKLVTWPTVWIHLFGSWNNLVFFQHFWNCSNVQNTEIVQFFFKICLTCKISNSVFIIKISGLVSLLNKALKNMFSCWN